MDEILIQRVREHEFLYNHGSSEYRDKHIRQSAWEEIGRELQIPADEAKERWCKLRRCFCNAKGRRRVGTKSGMGAKKKSLWKYEQLMSFIVPYLDTRKSHSNNNLNDRQASTNLATEAEDLSDEYETQEEETTTTDALQKPNLDIDTENERNSYTYKVAESQSAFNNIETNKTLRETVRLVQNKKQKRPTDSPAYEMFKILKENSGLRELQHKQKSVALTTSNKTSLVETLDDTDLFFLSMSRMTKKLPKTEQTQIKLALSNSVLSAELKVNQQSFFSSPSSASRYSNEETEYA